MPQSQSIRFGAAGLFAAVTVLSACELGNDSAAEPEGSGKQPAPAAKEPKAPTEAKQPKPASGKKGLRDKMKCSRGGCTQICGGGKRCKLLCSGGKCPQSCKGGSDCRVACSGGGCQQTCEEGADCKLKCSGGGCRQDCASAECDKSCSAGGCT